ncbi:TIGR00266 family protein [Mycoplasma sp. P36-A1]|uniref:TIGR00266 family protein n=1 Tax=Mycoplasma sp. P36-A1 TaxID=3252900 RepID=UPI003C2B002B
MNVDISQNTAFPIAEVTLNADEKIKIESGSMVYMRGNVKLEGNMNSNGSKGVGGVLKALGRSMTSGESFFITSATGKENNSKIALAPAAPGVIKKLEVGQIHWRLNTGVFLACEESVSYNMVRQSIGRAILSGTGGLFVMETTGAGELLINTYGDLIEINLDGSERFVIDNYHVVAWSDTLTYDIEIASGVFGFTTGEGVVNVFNGKGTVLIQSRNIQQLASVIDPFVTKAQ